MIPASSVLEAVSIAAMAAADDYMQDNYGDVFGTPRMPYGFYEFVRYCFEQAINDSLGEGTDLANEVSLADWQRDAQVQDGVARSLDR